MNSETLTCFYLISKCILVFCSMDGTFPYTTRPHAYLQYYESPSEWESQCVCFNCLCRSGSGSNPGVALDLFIPSSWNFILKKMSNWAICMSGGSVVRAFAPWAGGRGFNPQPRHIKDVIKMVPYAFLLSAQQIRIGLASLSSPLKPRSKNVMDFIRNERSRVINISWDNLFRDRP